MPKTSQKSTLDAARKNKNDEFYTQLSDIAKELKHYKHHFSGKVVYCNCDDPRVSKFFHYFSYSFEGLKLKKLISACYKSQNPDIFSLHDSEKAIYLKYDGDKNDNRVPDPEEIGIHQLESDGDFRSDECIALLKQADIVVTNPPFSLFREYIAQLIQYDKKFVVLGSMNALAYKEIFPFVKAHKLWIGNKPIGSDMLFDVSEEFAQELVATKKEGSGYKIIDGVIKGRSSAIWYTNLDIKKRHEDFPLGKTYAGNESDYPKYDNYDAIEIGKVNNIPKDYAGVMGVPISFFDKYNPDQFEIVGFRKGEDGKDLSINGKYPYMRILIKNKRL